MIITRPLLFSWLQTIALALTYLGIGIAIDHIIGGEPVSTGALVLLVICPIVAGIAIWAANAGFPKALTRTESADRDAILQTIIAKPAAAQSHEWTGRTVSTATDAVERSANYRVTFLGPMIGAMTSPIIATLIIGIALDWKTAAWLLVALPLIPVLIGAFQRAFSSVSKRYRIASRRLAARYLDAIQGLSTLRALGADRAHGDVFADEAENVRKHVMRLLLGNQLILLVSDAAFSLGMVTVASVLAIERTVAGVLTPGQAVAVVLISTLLLEPLDRIGQFFYIGMGGIAAKREIKRFVSQGRVSRDESSQPDSAAGSTSTLGDERTQADSAAGSTSVLGDERSQANSNVANDDAANANAPVTETSETTHAANAVVDNPNLIDDVRLDVTVSELTADSGVSEPTQRHVPPAVAFDHVSFGYQANHAVLMDFTWHVAEGEHVAIIGPSGGGKSTLLNLIQGVYHPSEGAVIVGGELVQESDPQRAAAHIGIVAQSTYLFTGSLAHNLRIAAPKATDEELWQALADANLHEVHDWPRGLETQIGERGLTLSGGQAQRIAIARALLKDAPILLLDEPTSHVDPDSEVKILDALERLVRGRTVIAVTHRMRTAGAADRIYEMRDGRLLVTAGTQDAHEYTVSSRGPSAVLEEHSHTVRKLNAAAHKTNEVTQ